ncbi:helix-turn-helix domain-containing protein [Acutalibacter sp. 1XD8-36]|uniref:helix-turn-helix domain-containing protein n=1 Tax=Acutalibacter sp. 1XD8-36 TaxID=2320852 RepID=UPI00141260EC|nr:helix-turn-helix domain-containing protein [Acutalibacter sp. 1XD8-36]NBJ89861.1 helix-turn-helix domain-containing protein [Acutalibacter sp. 1XD8-36]
MAARLTDKQKKKIIADYVQLGSYNAVSKIHGVSATTVKNVVLKSSDFVKKCEQKKEQNTEDILAYMESKRNVVCEILGKGLDVLNDEEKLKEASPAQITTALGTLIDKWTETFERQDKQLTEVEDLTLLAEKLKE